PEDRLVAEVAAERTPARGHQWRGRVLPVLAPVRDVLVVGDVAPVGEGKVRHVLGALPGRALDDLAVALEDNTGDLVEATVVQVLHDRDDRLLALADGDQVEMVDKGLGLSRRVWTADDGERLAAHL